MISAGLRACVKLIVVAPRVGSAASRPFVGPWPFDVDLDDAAGLPAFGIVETRPCVCPERPPPREPHVLYLAGPVVSL